MKQTCDGCKALSLGSCQLGYSTKSVFKKIGQSMIEELKPTEDCPKPLTIKKFFQLSVNKAP